MWIDICNMGHPQNIKRREEKMNFIPKNLRLQDLILHPNNYRFFDNPDYKKRLADRYSS
jgi:hypothetical protein